jgi:hypothetical protein
MIVMGSTWPFAVFHGADHGTDPDVVIAKFNYPGARFPGRGMANPGQVFLDQCHTFTISSKRFPYQTLSVMVNEAPSAQRHAALRFESKLLI